MLPAAYCYKWSSMVCEFVTVVIPAKTAELIEVPFECGLGWAQGTSIIRWGPDPLC